MKKLLFLLLISSSAWAQQVAPKKFTLNDFKLIVKVEDQEKYYNEMLQAKPEDPSKPTQYNEYRVPLAIGWLAKGTIQKYRYYTSNDPSFSVIHLLDVVYALEYLESDSKYLSIVENVSKEIIEKIEKAGGKDEISRGRMQVLLEINAMANAKLGNLDVAKKNIERASTINGDRDIKYFKDSRSSYYNRYTTILSAAGEHKRALDTLVNAFRNADSNPKMVATFKQVYKKVHGSEKGADKLLESLQEEAYKKYYKEVEKLYIADSKIPLQGTIELNGKTLTILTASKHVKEISIPDLHGKVVNFADHKGKILVIDFWTTACTPCVAAFAGFERVVADYKKEPFQLYVIDLFEEQETVKSFVAKKPITLDVLHDQPNKAYDIQATPTKIIFDPMGNIRFYAATYAGSTDREYYKLKAMVEIVKTRASSGKLAAF
jgi:thiol-disulfide isomerase/thioredoxin